MKKKIFALLLIITALLYQNVNAEEINKFYTNAKDNLEVKETVNGDSALAGDKILINGKLQGIGFIAGNEINIKGSLDYGFIAGNEVNIKGTINNSLYLAGNKIEFNKDSNIGKDAFIAGEEITLNGTLNRDVNIYATKITIKEGAIINNNITINATSLKIEKNVTISGTLKYNENAKTNISNKAIINNIEKIKIENQEINTGEILASILNLVITFACISIILPQTIEKTNKLHEKQNIKNYIKNIGTGLLMLICMPLICMLLLMSNIGIAIGLILTAIYIISIYLAYVLSGYILGKLLLIKVLKLKINENLTGILGIIILKLLILIPVLGQLIALLAIALGLTNIFNLISQKESNETPTENQKEKEIKNKVKEIKKNSIAK